MGIGRRRVLTSGLLSLMGALLPGVSQAASPRAQGTALSLPPPLRRGSRLRAVNPGTWISPDTDFTQLRQRCAAEGWILEIPDTIWRQWQWFSGTDGQRVGELEEAWADPTLDGLIVVGGAGGLPGCLRLVSVFPVAPSGPLVFPIPALCCSRSGR